MLSQLKSGKSSRSVSEAELEPLLDRLMHVFRYIGSKDVFEAFYKKDLAKVRDISYSRGTMYYHFSP